jgi:hypothetical protein
MKEETGEEKGRQNLLRLLEIMLLPWQFSKAPFSLYDEVVHGTSLVFRPLWIPHKHAHNFALEVYIVIETWRDWNFAFWN